MGYAGVLLDFGPLVAGGGDLKIHLQALEPVLLPADAHMRGDGRALERGLALAGNAHERVLETGCIARRKELFRVRSRTAGSAEFLGVEQRQVEHAIRRADMPMAATLGRGGCSVEGLHGLSSFQVGHTWMPRPHQGWVERKLSRPEIRSHQSLTPAIPTNSSLCGVRVM